MPGKILPKRLIDQVRRALRRYGGSTRWLDRIEKEASLEIYYGAYQNPQYIPFTRDLQLPETHLDPRYKHGGKTVVRDGYLPKLVHELWHVYCHQLAGKEMNRSLLKARKQSVRQQIFRLARTEEGKDHDAALAWGFKKAEAATDELVGHYLENVTIVLARIRSPRWTPTEREAQRKWDKLLSLGDAQDPGRTINLSKTEYNVPEGAYVIPLPLARKIRRELVGLPDDVSKWPEHRRTWAQRWKKDAVDRLIRELDRQEGLSRKTMQMAKLQGWRGRPIRLENGRRTAEPTVTGHRIRLGLDLSKEMTRKDLEVGILNRIQTGLFLWLEATCGFSPRARKKGPFLNRPSRYRR